MKIINNHKVCSGCKFSSFHFCEKYNEICLSIRINSNRHQLICNSCLQNDSYIFGLNEKEKINYPMANFRLPGLQNFKEIKSLLYLKQYYPDIFYKNRNIIAIYDAFPGALWNGRQPNFTGKIYSQEEMIDLKNDLEHLNLSLNLTWNNNLIAGLDVYDKFCNIITEIFHNGRHSITVSSNELYDYLKTNYPNYTFYQSAIALDNISSIDFNTGYDKYVISRKLNNNWDELLKIPQDERNRIEFLCNDFCPPFCNRMYHYNLGNQLLLNRQNPINPVKNYCSIDYDFINFNNKYWPTTINPEQIDSYLEQGFYNFKLCSRGDQTSILLLKILPYFVKPEYLLDAFSWIINHYDQTELIMDRRSNIDNY